MVGEREEKSVFPWKDEEWRRRLPSLPRPPERWLVMMSRLTAWEKQVYFLKSLTLIYIKRQVFPNEASLHQQRLKTNKDSRQERLLNRVFLSI